VIPLLGFSPDVDPTTPGAVMECQNFIPEMKGMRAAPRAQDAGVAALAAACKGAAVTRNLSGASRLFAGTASNLYELGGLSWSSVGSGYSLGVDDVWRFAAFGNSVLAISPSTQLQRSTGAAFSAVAAAPFGKTVVASQGFVMVLGYGIVSDGWKCSAFLNETDWTPSVATQSGEGRLIEGQGPINAGLRMGNAIVAYKDRGIFVGEYVGGATIWQWVMPVGDVGCVGVEAVADTPRGHVFVGSDNIYLFDGHRATAVGDQVRQWWIDNSSAQFRYRTKLMWDRDNALVWMFYPSAGSQGDCDRSMVFHVPTGKWGVVDHTVQTALNYTSGGFTYDSGASLGFTYDTGPEFSYDSPFWLASKSNPAFFGPDNKIMSLTGIPEQSWFVTGDVGDEAGSSFMRAVRVRWSKLPDSSVCTGYTKTTSGAVSASGSVASFDGSKYAMRQTARFHRVRIDMEGDGRLSHVAFDLKAGGVR
jgi:hypothetical protein